MGELQERLVRKGIRLNVAPSAKRLILNEGHDEKFGARPLRRAMQEMLEHSIAEGVLSGEYEKGTVIKATAAKGQVVLNVEREA